jgi:hypothetical protein
MKMKKRSCYSDEDTSGLQTQQVEAEPGGSSSGSLSSQEVDRMMKEYIEATCRLTSAAAQRLPCRETKEQAQRWAKLAAQYPNYFDGEGQTLPSASKLGE